MLVWILVVTISWPGTADARVIEAQKPFYATAGSIPTAPTILLGFSRSHSAVAGNKQQNKASQDVEGAWIMFRVRSHPTPWPAPAALARTQPTHGDLSWRPIP